MLLSHLLQEQLLQIFVHLLIHLNIVIFLQFVFIANFDVMNAAFSQHVHTVHLAPVSQYQ